MKKLSKVRKDGLLQSQAFFYEAVGGLFGAGLWYLGRINQAIIRTGLTLVAILCVFIPRAMYDASTIQDVISNKVFGITLFGVLLLIAVIIWNMVSLLMIFKGTQKDGYLVKINDWEKSEVFASNYNHIEHKSFSILEIEAGILDNHADLRSNHHPDCPNRN